MNIELTDQQAKDIKILLEIAANTYDFDGETGTQIEQSLNTVLSKLEEI